MVLDASFALAWVLPVERTPMTLKYYDSMLRQEIEALVPALWADEMANVFLSMERSRKLTAAQVTGWMDVFKNLPITVEPPSLADSFGEVRSLAQAHGLSSYDARYLHLAMREDVHLATKDKQLLIAAPKVGVKVVS